jgi:hypothetical protein
LSLSRRDMPQGGHAETVEVSEIELVTIWVKLRKLSRVNL